MHIQNQLYICWPFTSEETSFSPQSPHNLCKVIIILNKLSYSLFNVCDIRMIFLHAYQCLYTHVIGLAVHLHYFCKPVMLISLTEKSRGEWTASGGRSHSLQILALKTSVHSHFNWTHSITCIWTQTGELLQHHHITAVNIQ